MFKTTIIPKILFIKGVFKKDCVSDDIFEKKILENSVTELSSNNIVEISNEILNQNNNEEVK